MQARETSKKDALADFANQIHGILTDRPLKTRFFL
jgi:hypothetical protein